ncbi:uncharacterized membrane protein YhaH (DUF805 family) [Mesorhizobium soli]|uniref:hypothetical protein n=1 Tax=Pseudaminobacter soli (ex Li et al. 2025) TaxID=1295366 RepID=UPI0024759CFD|nr:hypothetical protein [Mesorhizobium soli]MDH6231528.1 uncharacterized membrane protein YhaH (DUF805 family) [Mesorhizobium soli]
MNKYPVHTTDRLHPFVYAALVALAAFYVIAAWIGFGAGENTDYLLSVMTGFFIMIVVLPTIAWHTWRAHRRRRAPDEKIPSFSEWASEQFYTSRDHMSGSSAAIQVLLPIAAVAFGMVAFAIVARLSG